MDRERRRFLRMDYREPLQYRLKEGQAFTGSITKDIGEGGVQFKVNEFIPLNTKIDIQMELDSSIPLQFKGLVSWIQLIPHSDAYYVGAKFETSDDAERGKQAIHQYIQSHRF